MLKGLSSEIDLAESGISWQVSERERRQDLFVDFTHLLSCGRPFKFSRHLLRAFGIYEITAMLDMSIPSNLHGHGHGRRHGHHTDKDMDTDMELE
jgi:hypothetical protein